MNTRGRVGEDVPSTATIEGGFVVSSRAPTRKYLVYLRQLP